MLCIVYLLYYVNIHQEKNLKVNTCGFMLKSVKYRGNTYLLFIVQVWKHIIIIEMNRYQNNYKLQDSKLIILIIQSKYYTVKNNFCYHIYNLL